MNVTINGKQETIERTGLTVSEILKMKEVKMPEMVSVELNDEFLERNSFERTEIKEGDKLEFLYFMGGGN